MVAYSGFWKLFNNLYDSHRILEQSFFQIISLFLHLTLQYSMLDVRRSMLDVNIFPSTLDVERSMFDVRCSFFSVNLPQSPRV
jgi:hypothetical protein